MSNKVDNFFLFLAILGAGVQFLVIITKPASYFFYVVSFLLLGSSFFYILIRSYIFQRSKPSTKDQERQQLEKQVERLNQQLNILTGSWSEGQIAYNFIAQRYGVGYSLLDINFEIKVDGSAIVTRTVEIEAFSTIGKLDTYLLIPERSVDGTERDIESAKLESFSPDHTITIQQTKESETDQVLSVVLSISPPLQKGDAFKFRMVESLPIGLYGINLSEEELNKRTDPYDYSGWNISRPSKKLTLNVHFPEFYVPDIFDAEVRYATATIFPSQRTQQEEQQRLKPQMIPVGDHLKYSLEVDYPMIGLIYILRWKPTPASSH